VITLGLVEGAGGNNLDDDRLLETLLDVLLRRFGGLPLRFVANEDRGAILIADVAELTMRVQRIDVLPEVIEQLLVADLRRIEHDLHGFRVARSAVRHLLVGRILDVPAGVTRRR